MINKIKRVCFDEYKSFYKKEVPYAINLEKSFSLIIGRNNSGKSSLIDVLQTVFQYNGDSYMHIIENPKKYKIIKNLALDFVIDKAHICEGFGYNVDVDSYYADDALRYALRFINQIMRVSIEPQSFGFKELLIQGEKVNEWQINHLGIKWNSVANLYSEEFSSIRFLRIDAERDIVPEYESTDDVVKFNGSGTTNLIRKFINNDKYAESVVEKTILRELNSILDTDAHYTGIRVQQVEEGTSSGDYKWEIFLVENEKRYALSKSGSGLKTILLVLVNLYLIPETENYKGKQIVYAFEELENNLHPALQRRLCDYLYAYSLNKSVKIFLTSHSSTTINTFYGKEDVNIFFINKVDNKSSIEKIKNGEKAQELIDDLGVKASDLLQTNGIIWVEGPSDRIYINKWLEIFCDNKYIEGKDYQYLYYGGRLLSHYTVKQYKESFDSELINMLSINRHSAIVIDSDKKSKSANINPTKKRVEMEVQRNGGYCWITKGKEIENYIPAEAVNQIYNSKLIQIGPYDLFQEYIKKYNKRFSYEKVKEAKLICNYLTKENSENILDLKKQIEGLYNIIKEWNRIN